MQVYRVLLEFCSRDRFHLMLILMGMSTGHWTSNENGSSRSCLSGRRKFKRSFKKRKRSANRTDNYQPAITKKHVCITFPWTFAASAFSKLPAWHTCMTASHCVEMPCYQARARQPPSPAGIGSEKKTPLSALLGVAQRHVDMGGREKWIKTNKEMRQFTEWNFEPLNNHHIG